MDHPLGRPVLTSDWLTLDIGQSGLPGGKRNHENARKRGTGPTHDHEPETLIEDRRQPTLVLPVGGSDLRSLGEPLRGPVGKPESRRRLVEPRSTNIIRNLDKTIQRPPGTEILARLATPTISPTAIPMLSRLLENATDKQYFLVWAIFSSVVFIRYYRWPGRRVSRTMRRRPAYGLLIFPSSTTFLRSDLHPKYFRL